MDCEIYSVKELPEKMLRFNKNGYSLKSFREKLKSRFKEHVYYVKVNNSELVCFDNMTDYILREMKEKFSTKESVLTAAAKIIKADIRELNVGNQSTQTNKKLLTSTKEESGFLKLWIDL